MLKLNLATIDCIVRTWGASMLDAEGATLV